MLKRFYKKLALFIVVTPVVVGVNADDKASVKKAVPVAAKSKATQVKAKAKKSNVKLDKKAILLQKQIKDEIGRELLSRQEKELSAYKCMDAGREAYQKSEFLKAADKYLEARELLEQCSATNAGIQAKRKVCGQMIAKCYSLEAERIAQKAEDAARVKDYDKATAYAQKAAQMDPSLTEKMGKAIERYQKMKGVVQYRVNVDPKTIDPKESSRNYNIAILIRKGNTFFADNQLDKARDVYEEALTLDPYNMQVIEALRQLNKKLIEVGKMRTYQMREERKAEVTWNMITPLIPRTLSGETESLHQTVARDNIGNKIQQKLDDIIIPHMAFEEVTIPTVVRYLRQKSKVYDKEHVGVNIFLRLSKGKQETAAAGDDDDDAAAGDDDDDDAMAGDDDDDDDAATGDDDDDDAAGNAGEQTVTMVVDDIPLGKAIRYICRATNLKYRIEKHAIVIASRNIPFDEVETRIYPLEQEALTLVNGDDAEGAVQKYFQDRGINFPDGARIVYDARISRLIATNTPENLNRIEEIIRELNVVDPQVLIQTKFVEVVQNDLDELGFSYTIDHSNGGNAGGNEGSNTYTAASHMRNVGADGLGDVNVGNRKDQLFNITRTEKNGNNINAVMHALDQSDSADVLSTPRVTTMNGQEASIRMITEKYYPTEWTEATVGSNVSGAFFMSSIPVFGDPTEEGIVLRVTPNVDADHYTISMEMNPVVQKFLGWLDYSYDVAMPGVAVPIENKIQMPIIEARTVETSVSIYDGETIMLGGIIRDSVDTIDDQTPILGDMPLVGRLFQSKAKRAVKKNLLIFLTARLVNPDGSPIRERELRGLPSFRQ